MSITDPMAAWTSEDDIAMIKGGSWPCGFALAMKKRTDRDYEHGCVASTERTVVLRTNIFDFNPYAKRTEYNSVEEMVANGWMVD